MHVANTNTITVLLVNQPSAKNIVTEKQINQTVRLLYASVAHCGMRKKYSRD